MGNWILDMPHARRIGGIDKHDMQMCLVLSAVFSVVDSTQSDMQDLKGISEEILASD